MTKEFSRKGLISLHKRPKVNKNYLLGTSFLLGILLSGCSLSQEQPQIVIDKIVAQPEIEDNLNVQASNAKVEQRLSTPASANTVFRLLAAETLAAKGMTEPAAQVYLELAQDQPDQVVAQRAYELATQTSDRKLLEAATQENTKINPDFLESWQIQILLALRAGDAQKAIDYWKGFYNHSKETGLADKDIFLSAATLGQESINPDVLETFGAGVAAQHPDSSMALLMQVVFAINSERWQTGFNLLWQGLEKYPEQAELAQLLASMMTRQPSDKGITWLKAYLERHPNELGIREQLARALVTNKQLEAAKEQFLIIQAAKSTPSVQMSLGLIELELDHPAEAEQWIRPLLPISNLNEMANYYLGQAMLMQGQKDEALELWEKVQGSDYGLDALIWRTQTLFDLNRQDEAFTLLKTFEPTNDHDYSRWVRVQVRLSLLIPDAAKAITILNLAIAQKPEVSDFWRDRANLRYDSGDVKGFESDMRHAMSLNDQDSDILNALGYFLADNNRSLPEAHQLLEKANRISPNKYHILDSLGWLAFREGNLSQAQTLLEQAYQLQADSEILAHWLAVLVAQGNQQKAKQLAQDEGSKYLQDKSLQNLLQQILSK